MAKSEAVSEISSRPRRERGGALPTLEIEMYDHVKEENKRKSPRKKRRTQPGCSMWNPKNETNHQLEAQSSTQDDRAQHGEEVVVKETVSAGSARAVTEVQPPVIPTTTVMHVNESRALPARGSTSVDALVGLDPPQLLVEARFDVCAPPMGGLNTAGIGQPEGDSAPQYAPSPHSPVDRTQTRLASTWVDNAQQQSFGESSLFLHAQSDDSVFMTGADTHLPMQVPMQVHVEIPSGVPDANGIDASLFRSQQSPASPSPLGTDANVLATRFGTRHGFSNGPIYNFNTCARFHHLPRLYSEVAPCGCCTLIRDCTTGNCVGIFSANQTQEIPGTYYSSPLSPLSNSMTDMTLFSPVTPVDARAPWSDVAGPSGTNRAI